MYRRAIWIFLTLALLATAAPLIADEPAPSNEQRVRDFVAAYNRHDVDGMMSMVSDDIQWLTVVNDKISVELQGALKLRESMANYFKSSPSVRSELVWLQATTARVAAWERAFWKGKAGEKSQSSLSVYELEGGRIVRVYYYPVEK